MPRLWIVRASRHGERELAAIAENRLMPGFTEVGDLRVFPNRDAIATHLAQVMPDAGENRRRNFAAQLNQFAHVIQQGDLVILPRKVTNGVAIGKITGDYVFDSNDPCRHSRAVTWMREAISRDSFKQNMRHSFGAFMTICEIRRNSALTRVMSVIQNGTDPGALVGQQGVVITALAPEGEANAEESETDIEDLANHQIISLVKSEFAGHALADLVAEILEVEGYKTKVSRPGPDGGVDILAAGGKLALGEDRICVQVKSGDGPANHDVVLRLIGAMSNSQARTGLLVSIGGVNAAAQQELDNNFFKLRLWQMRDLLNALFRAYGDLSDETREKLPLKQIWAPMRARE
jgi:restriction system protein